MAISYKVYNKLTYPTQETCHDNLLKALEYAFKQLALVMSEDQDISNAVIEVFPNGYEIFIDEEMYISITKCY